MCPGAVFTFLHELVEEESSVLAPAGVGERMVRVNDFLPRKQPGHRSWRPRQQAHSLPTGRTGPPAQLLGQAGSEGATRRIQPDQATADSRFCLGPRFRGTRAGPDAGAGASEGGGPQGQRPVPSAVAAQRPSNFSVLFLIYKYMDYFGILKKC